MISVDETLNILLKEIFNLGALCVNISRSEVPIDLYVQAVENFKDQE